MLFIINKTKDEFDSYSFISSFIGGVAMCSSIQSVLVSISLMNLAANNG